jgi:beta-lactamase regulating signal transducer with metallopeptidase domain
LRVDRVREFIRAANASLPLIVTVWLVGVALLSLRLLVQWLRVRRLVERDASPAREPWPGIARRLAAALGVRQAVRLLESAAIEAPAVLGYLRPVILLPASSLMGLTPDQLEMILAHELAHIRRHDFLVNLLQSAVETLLFYHPAVWWISDRIRIEREHCCDDLAVATCGSPVLYARALTRLEELRAQTMPLAVHANGGSLLDRIRRIVRVTTPSGGPVRGAAALAAFVVLLLAIASPSLSAMAKKDKVAKPTDRDVYSRRERVASKESKQTLKEEWKHVVESDASTRDATLVDPANDAADAESVPADEALADVASNHGRQRLSIDDLIALRAQNVSAENVLEMRFLFKSVDLREIAGMAAVGATPRFVREMRAIGLDVDSPSEAQSLAAVGVTPEFVRAIREAGIPVETAEDAQGLAALGVQPEFVREMRAAGMDVQTAKDACGLAAVGVSPEFIRGMRATGLAIESASQMQSLAAVGVTPDYVREMRQAGIVLDDAGEVQSLRAMGVTPTFVRRLARAGYKNLSAEELRRYAAGGLTDSFIREMSQYRTK